MSAHGTADASARTGIGVTLVRSTGAVMSRFGETARAILLVQGAVVLVGIPLLGWLFPVLLSLLGERSITAIDLRQLLQHPVAVTVYCALLLGLGALLLAELLAFLVLAGRRLGRHPTPPALHDVAVVARRLAHPSTLLLVPLLALLLPFGGLALGGLFTGGLRFDFPLTSELLDSLGGTLLFAVLLCATGYVEARLAFTLPLLVTGAPHVGAAMRESWTISRGGVLRIVALVAVVVLVTVVLASGLAAVGLAPTRYADANLPDAAPIVAALSLTLIEIALFLLVGLAVSVLAQSAMAAVRRFRVPAAQPPADRQHARARPLRRAILLALGAATVGSLVVSNSSLLSSLSDGSSTMIVAHRGVFSDVVENTVDAVEAAAVAGPDFVEVDVQETANGGFVVFHDTTLRRLAGDPRRLSELTTRELGEIELRQAGREAHIPTLVEVLHRARELDQPLFLELKIHGHESPRYLENLIAVLRHQGAIEHVRVASFDRETIERFAELAPEVPVGLLVSLNLGTAPDTTADFLIVSMDSYTPALRDEAWARGLELYVWTVNDMRAVRDLLRDSVDGIITDRTFAADAERQNIRYETGITRRLEDALRRALGG